MKVGRSGFYIWVGLLLVIIAVGIYAWSQQLQYGLIMTNMRNIVSWGIYIALFAWFVGVSAGGLIVSSATILFNIREWHRISRIAAWTALVSILLAAFSILPDLGRPDRLMNLFLYSQWYSPLIWDLAIIVTYILVLIAELWALSKGVGGNVLKALGLIGLSVAILTHSITAWIFGVQIARPLWHSALLAPTFIASALVSGLALVILISIITRSFGIIRLKEGLLESLAKLLAVLVIVDLFLLSAEYITAFWAGAPIETEPFLVQFLGPFKWLAWGEWALAILAFFMLAIPYLRKSSAVQLIASLLVLTEIFIYRIELVINGFTARYIEYPPGTALGSFQTGMTPFTVQQIYSPSAIEWAITFGMLAGAALLITLGLKYLPTLRETESIE